MNMSSLQLFVIGLPSHDHRCQETLQEMVEDPRDVFEIESWEELERLTYELTFKNRCNGE